MQMIYLQYFVQNRNGLTKKFNTCRVMDTKSLNKELRLNIKFKFITCTCMSNTYKETNILVFYEEYCFVHQNITYYQIPYIKPR